MDAKSRSTALRMAGNIAAGLVARSGEEELGQDSIAKRAVSIALLILDDERLRLDDAAIHELRKERA